MTGIILPNGKQDYATANGEPLVGGKLYTYQAGTNTPATTWSDAAQTVPNTNPVILDARGEATIFWLGTYKVILRDALDNLIWSVENITATDLTALVAPYAKSTDLASSTPGKGASLIGTESGGTVQDYIDGGSSVIPFTQSGTSPLAATVQSKLRQVLNAADFTGFDATGVTSSTTAIQNAINEANARVRCDVWIPNGAKAGALTLPAGTGLVGPKSKAKIAWEAGNYAGLTVTGSDVSIENLEFTSTAKTGGADIVYACGSSTLERLRVRNIRTIDSRGMFADSGSGVGQHIDTKIEHYYSQKLNGPGVSLVRANAYIFVTDVSADYVNVPTGNFTGFSFDGSAFAGPGIGGLTLADLNVLGSAEQYTTGVSSQRAFNFNALFAVEMTRCKADGVGEYGFLFNNVGGLRASLLIANQCASGQLYLDTVKDAVFTNTHAIGRNLAGLVYKPANKDGIYLNGGCYGLVFAGGLCRDNTGNGFNKATAQAGGILASGMMSMANVGYGLRDNGNSGFLWSAGAFGANTAGDYTLSNTSGHIAATQGNSGAIINV